MSPNMPRFSILNLRAFFLLAAIAAASLCQQPLLAQTTNNSSQNRVSNDEVQDRIARSTENISVDNWWTFGLAEQAMLDEQLSTLMEAEPAEKGSASPSDTTSLDDWSRIAYQSLRDENWEIYTAHGGGANPVRITNHRASDVYPRLNHGVNRILFASNRSGNYDIYTMNSNGSGVTVLAPHPGTDTMPTWSKDGGRIAFASDRDGDKPDIYVMNGDGSDFYRIRIDNTIDVMPRMAPDSHQIAWIRIDNDGNQQVWVMNGRGGNQRQLTGNQLIQNMAWSPDGTQLMVASNNAADPWYDLYLIDVESGAMSDFSLAPTGHDYYLGGWSPDGSSINFSDLRYRQQGSQWGLTAISLRRIPADGCCISSLSNGTLALASDWRSADITPPVVQITELPQYSRFNTATIQWDGVDSAPGRVRSYDVQIKDSQDREWQEWHTDIQNWSRDYNAEGGETVGFRVRAYDEAGNASEWSEEVSTTFYYRIARGYVRDVRGVPLPRASVIIEPALHPASIDVNGRYEVMLAKHRMSEIEISHIGYKTQTVLPNSRSTFNENFYLTDEINLIENGNFEHEQDPLAGWVHNGATAEVESSLWGSASASLFLERGDPIKYIRQSVTIPETMHKPQLSFSYSTYREGVTFEVAVDDGDTETSIFTSSGIGWNNRFMNVSLEEWVGETITTTFIYYRSAENNAVKQAFLDDVSIGPWLTPTFVQSTSDDLVPGASSTMLINGENFVETPTIYIGDVQVSEVRKIDEESLEIELPETLNPGSHTLTLVASGGQATMSEGAIQIGLHSYLPLIVE